MFRIVLALIFGVLILIGIPVTIAYIIDWFFLRPRRQEKRIKKLEEELEKNKRKRRKN